MIRTQIYLDEELRRELAFLAEQDKASVAKIARDLLREGIERKKVDKSGKANLLAIANMNVKGEDTHLSENIDTYLYGSPKANE